MSDIRLPRNGDPCSKCGECETCGEGLPCDLGEPLARAVLVLFVTEARDALKRDCVSACDLLNRMIEAGPHTEVTL